MIEPWPKRKYCLRKLFNFWSHKKEKRKRETKNLSSMVGSYSSIKRFWKSLQKRRTKERKRENKKTARNMKVRADFPTPGEPRSATLTSGTFSIFEEDFELTTPPIFQNKRTTRNGKEKKRSKF